ncbi:MAG: hypothetical protein QOH57_92 [Mycobacterium sp.]|jgi:hypothetical protein|nr:hypothetical protein [Mycobacterium sp.]
MEPKDDPEARIRELEQPLSDVARASELDSTPPAAASIPPDYSAGPFPPPVGPTSSGSGGFGFLVAAVVVVVVAVVAGVMVFVNSSGTTSTTPTTTGSSAAPSASSPPSGRLTQVAPPGGKLSVFGSDKNENLACNESFVDVSGSSNTVLITGHCASLTVSGFKNVVTVDAADTIRASGFDNQVTYRSGTPTVNKSGRGNVVQSG